MNEERPAYLVNVYFTIQITWRNSEAVQVEETFTLAAKDARQAVDLAIKMISTKLPLAGLQISCAIDHVATRHVA